MLCIGAKYFHSNRILLTSNYSNIVFFHLFINISQKQVILKNTYIVKWEKWGDSERSPSRRASLSPDHF